MIKKFSAIILCLLTLTACTSQNRNADINILSDRINSCFEEDVFDENKTKMTQEGDYYIVYWMPEKYSNICVSFYCEKEIGNVEKSKILIVKDEEHDGKFIELFEKAIRYNNKYIEKSDYSTCGYKSITFSDRRFKEKSTDPLLKKEIIDGDLY